MIQTTIEELKEIYKNMEDKHLEQEMTYFAYEVERELIMADAREDYINRLMTRYELIIAEHKERRTKNEVREA